MSNEIAWALTRGSGLTAFVLLTVVVALGLALSMRAASPTWTRGLTTETHRSLTTLALAMIGLHLLTLLVDGDTTISLIDLVVPFVSGWRPLAVGLGVVGLWIVVFTWASTAMRARLGRRRWAVLHRLAILGWVAALAHGLLAGSDTSAPWAVFVYVLSAAVVGMLFVMRVLAARRPAPPAPAPATAPQRPADSGLPPLAPRPSRAGPLPPLRSG